MSAYQLFGNTVKGRRCSVSEAICGCETDATQVGFVRQSYLELGQVHDNYEKLIGFGCFFFFSLSEGCMFCFISQLKKLPPKLLSL